MAPPVSLFGTTSNPPLSNPGSAPDSLFSKPRYFHSYALQIEIKKEFVCLWVEFLFNYVRLDRKYKLFAMKKREKTVGQAWIRQTIGLRKIPSVTVV